MASLDSGQSGFLQQEDAGNQVRLRLLPPSLSRARAHLVVQLSAAGVYVS